MKRIRIWLEVAKGNDSPAVEKRQQIFAAILATFEGHIFLSGPRITSLKMALFLQAGGWNVSTSSLCKCPTISLQLLTLNVNTDAIFFAA